MRKACFFIVTILTTVGIANGAVRDEKTILRNTQPDITSRTTQNTKKTSARTTSNKTISRNAAASRNAVTSRNTTQQPRTARTVAVSRTTTARSATKRQNNNKNITINASRTSRAATVQPTTQSNVFNAGYNTCRDAYFTCMDQFCATANDTYRRCVCSSKLPEIQARERALNQTSERLSDFKNQHLNVINKSAEEVTAMLSATAGEYTQSKTTDKSNSAKQLAGISEVLNKTKNQSLSTQGTLDIAGDINTIWSTSDLAGGANIANLTGEALYNAVHTQCSEMVADKCTSAEIQNMVTTSYGMYIENDCATLLNSLDEKKHTANVTIRKTEREVQLARLENYNAHNSTNINDCIAMVRAEITADTACGTDYVHCLDVTGLYLNRETGEPIYTANFYQLETMTSLSGDILTNQSNRLLVAELNRKREFASRALDTCRDIANSVWDEYLRQAISEIYQGQQKRIRTVKENCLEVVNKCYDEKQQSLKDFSNTKEQLLLGQRMQLSQTLCQEKLDTCSNLYGGGPTGFSELLIAMNNLATQNIANKCQSSLREFLRETCTPPSSDTIHSYPYACRTIYPGYAHQSTNSACRNVTSQAVLEPIEKNIRKIENTTYKCRKVYTKCKSGYYLHDSQCYQCPAGWNCPTGSTYIQLLNSANCSSYVGSLYQKLSIFASQSCTLNSTTDSTLPATISQDINIAMTELRQDMVKELAKECERLGGIWHKKFNAETDEENKHAGFYTETGANTEWGYCGQTTTNQTQNEITTCTQDYQNNCIIPGNYNAINCIEQGCTFYNNSCVIPNNKVYAPQENKCVNLNVCKDNNQQNCLVSTIYNELACTKAECDFIDNKCIASTSKFYNSEKVTCEKDKISSETEQNDNVSGEQTQNTPQE